MRAEKTVILFCFFWMLAGCTGKLPATSSFPASPSSTTQAPPATAKPLTPAAPTAAPTAVLLPTNTPLPSAILTITPTLEPAGCWIPPEDYTQVKVNGWVINQRTLAMLEHAAALYGGELEITGYHITQGSYHDNGAASFGTHLGGGAVDLSVMRRGTYTVLWEDVEPLVHSLRVSGFAAWLREYGEISPGSPIHIHAIAIGDRELSQAAIDQLTGPSGYFYGFTGVPISGSASAPDRHGGPVICQWMLDAGYADLRR